MFLVLTLCSSSESTQGRMVIPAQQAARVSTTLSPLRRRPGDESRPCDAQRFLRYGRPL